MSVTELAAELGTVGILDDDANQALAMRLQLEDRGVEAVVCDLDEVPSIDRALSWVGEHAGSVICDVQLNNLHGGIDYDGASLMSRVIGESRIPGVLTTGFKDDVGMLVRPHRHVVPVLISRDEAEEADVLIAGVRACSREIARGRAPERETHRAPLFVEKASQADGVALDARVGGWARKASIRFPARMLNARYDELEAAQAIVGLVFFAHVNIGAEDEDDLFFERPEPELIDPRELPLHFRPDAS